MWWMRASLGVFVSHAGQTTDRMCNKTEDKQMTSARINKGALCDVLLTVILIIIITLWV